MGHLAFHGKLFTEVFVTLIVIMDPAGTIPVFLALTGGRSSRARKRLAWQAVAVSISVIAAYSDRTASGRCSRRCPRLPD